MPANHNTRKPDPPTIARHKIANPKVILNIGGLKHEVLLKAMLQTVLLSVCIQRYVIPISGDVEAS